MKVRRGFVSNSSSSSFVIAFKGKKEDAEKEILKALKVPESSPLYMIADTIAIAISAGDDITIKEAMLEEGYDTKEELFKDYPSFRYVENLIDKGYTVLEYNACGDDGDDWVGNLIHNHDLLREIDTPNLKMFTR